MKLFAQSLALLALATGTLVMSDRAQAQVAVDVDISVGSITILYYHDDIDVNIPDAVLASLFTPAGCAGPGLSNAIECIVPPPVATDATSPGAGQLNWIGSVNGTPAPTAVNAVALNLQNVWAVRALGGTSANTTVTVALGANATITGDTGSIVASNPRIDDAANACAGGASVTFPDPGLGTATQGSVCLSLDLTSAIDGPFDGAGDTGDSVYTLQVTGT